MRPSGNSDPVKAGIYTRMSLARMDDQTKVDDQKRKCENLAQQIGWNLAGGCGYPEADGVYCDNNKSAWRLDRKRRGWDTMLDDLRDGRLDAIVVYHGDRLIRQPRDLEDLIDLARAKGIPLASPTGTRDLGNPDDQFVLRIEAAMACRESDNISRRRKDQYERWRREGRTRPGGRGGRAFGFASDGLTQIPEECAVICEMADRILAGETPGPIARDLTARGMRTPGGFEFSHNTVIYILSRPRTAGLMPDGESRGAWEPVLDRQTWERVCLILEARAAWYDHTTNARRWLLSGIAVCGVCSEPLMSRYARRNIERGLEAAAVYGCVQPGCRKVQRSAELLDAYVSARVVHLLNDPRQPEGELPVQADDAPEWAALTAERAETERLAQDYATSPGRLRLLMSRLDSIDARLAELREREAGGARSRMLDQYRGITAEDFGAMPLSLRRSLVAASYRVTVLPASRRGPGFRTEDVRLEPLG